jgi:hypothetical protein
MQEVDKQTDTTGIAHQSNYFTYGRRHRKSFKGGRNTLDNIFCWAPSEFVLTSLHESHFLDFKWKSHSDHAPMAFTLEER